MKLEKIEQLPSTYSPGRYVASFENNQDIIHEPCETEAANVAAAQYALWYRGKKLLMWEESEPDEKYLVVNGEIQPRNQLLFGDRHTTTIYKLGELPVASIRKSVSYGFNYDKKQNPIQHKSVEVALSILRFHPTTYKTVKDAQDALAKHVAPHFPLLTQEVTTISDVKPVATPSIE